MSFQTLPIGYSIHHDTERKVKEDFCINSSFQNEKSIGDYVDELAYITQEDMKFSHIPKCSDEKDENWFE
jgi:hypothetical protein